MIRTDFSDQQAWERVKAGIGWTTPHGFEANVSYVDDPSWDGATVQQLLASGTDDSDHVLALVADETTFRSPEHPILVIDLESVPRSAKSRRKVRSFRALPHTIQEIENNLSIANMDWEEFADGADEDGVRRRHMLYGRAEDLPAAQTGE